MKSNAMLAQKIDNLEADMGPIIGQIANVLENHVIANGFLSIYVGRDGFFSVTPKGGKWEISKAGAGYKPRATYSMGDDHDADEG